MKGHFEWKLWPERVECWIEFQWIFRLMKVRVYWNTNSQIQSVNSKIKFWKWEERRWEVEKNQFNVQNCTYWITITSIRMQTLWIYWHIKLVKHLNPQLASCCFLFFPDFIFVFFLLFLSQRNWWHSDSKIVRKPEDLNKTFATMAIADIDKSTIGNLHAAGVLCVHCSVVQSFYW